MEISGKDLSMAVATYVNNINDKKEPDTSSGKASGTNVQEDRVELSSEMRQVLEVKKVYDSLPDIRDRKVDEIQKAIENGTYREDAEKIATRMIKDSLYV